jgi:hypothetical protein
MVATGGRQKLLSKQDTDRIFAFTKAEWDATAQTFIAPGWDVRFAKHHTGVHVIGFDPSTGFGFSLQPLYKSDIGPPTMIIIGNYFPSGQSPPITPERKIDMETVAIHALGPTYKVKANTTTVAMSSGNYDVIEFMVTIATV